MAKNPGNYLTHDNDNEGMPHTDDNQSNIDLQTTYTDEHQHSTHAEHNHDDHHHHGAAAREANAKVLLLCLIVSFSFAGIEGIGGYFTHSVALLSDALHMLTDAAGLMIAYIANNISRRPATVHLTFGYGKAEAVGALMNCTFTLILTAGLLIQVIERLFAPVTVHGGGLFIIAALGFIVNGGMALLLSHSHESLNTKAALIHTLGDLLASAVAILAGIIIYFTHINVVDPLLSIIVIVILFSSNYKLIRKSIMVLMAGVPENLDYQQIGADLEAIEDILSVHDLHIWYMSANQPALSAHIVAKDPYSWQRTLLACQAMLQEKHHISHITLQHEFNPCAEMNFCEIQ